MFCERLRVYRITAWRELDDGIEDVQRGRHVAAHRVLYRTPDALYINARDVRNYSLDDFVRESVERYSYVSDFVMRAGKAPARPEEMPTAVTPYSSDDFDRVLNVAQSMGQWAWAYCMILDLLGVETLNARNIVWAGFPHMSRIGVWANGRVLWLGGAARQVLEYWFTAHGGYHSKHTAYVDDRAAYERACTSVASPWDIADVKRVYSAIEQEWLPAALPENVRAYTPGDHVCDGVLYRANAEGNLLPLAYDDGNAPPDAPVCERTGWVLADRIQLLGRLGVPLQLREEILHGKAIV